MASSSTHMAILLCACIYAVNFGIVASEPSALEPDTGRPRHSASQRKIPKTDIELQAPTALESFLQGGDLTHRDAAAELQIPDALRISLQQSDMSPLRRRIVHPLAPTSPRIDITFK